MDSLKVAERLSNNFIASVSKLPLVWDDADRRVMEEAQSCAAFAVMRRLPAHQDRGDESPRLRRWPMAVCGSRLPPRVVRVFASECPAERSAGAGAGVPGRANGRLVLHGAIGPARRSRRPKPWGAKAVFLTPTDLPVWAWRPLARSGASQRDRGARWCDSADS